MDLLNKVKEAAASTSKPAPKEENPPQFLVKLFSFSNIDRVIQASHLIASVYHGANTLYLDKENDMYILALTPSDHSTNEFSKVCNMLSEYGNQERASASVLAFLEEHCEIVIASDSIQKLAGI